MPSEICHEGHDIGALQGLLNYNTQETLIFLN
jgi:hypothetical protein